MGSINTRVSVNITRQTRFPTRAGFGTPLLLGYHTKFAEKFRVYEELTGLTADGFAVSDPVYRMASAAFAQNPRPARVVVGRLPAAHTHTQTVTITSAVEGAKVKLTVLAPATGTATEIEYTILAAATTATVATAVELLIDAVTGVSSTSTGAVITVTPDTPGNIVYLHSPTNCKIKETTADAGYDDELAALKLVTPSEASWYAVAIDTASEANIDLVAAWAEANGVIFFADTHDDAEIDGTGTLGSGLKAAAYDRTATFYAPRPQEYASCRWFGACLPKDAGSVNWALRTLNGLTAAQLTPTQETNLRTNNVNFYVEIAGVNQTDGPDGGGSLASGERIDIIHGTDWFAAELQVAALAYLLNNDKVPFTDVTGVAQEGIVKKVLGQGVARQLFVADSITATATKVAAMSTGAKARREFGPCKFEATYQGAVNKFVFDGTLSL